MKATLYKIKEGYVLCSSEEIKDQDFVLTPDNKIVQAGMKEGQVGWGKNKTDFAYFGTAGSKVLTQSPDFSLLSEENAKEIGWFDVRKICDFIHLELYHDISDASFEDGFEKGFQKHAELTADRRFTEEDMYEAISMAQEFTQGHGHDYSASEIMEKLFQPKSWSVEYKEENGVYKVLSVS